MIVIGTTIAREDANFILAKMMEVPHIEYSFKCKGYKSDSYPKKD